MANDTYQLMGFAAEISGNEEHLVLAEPVLRIDDRFFIARASDWLTEELTEDELKFVTWVASDRPEYVRSGQFVWVAGRAFVAGVQTSSFLRKYSLQVSAWQVAKKGVRWTIGSRRQFAELHLGLAAQMEKAIGVYLFDAMEKSIGSADDVFKIYRGLDVPDSADRFTWLGVFFHELNRANRDFRITSRLAVRSGFFESDADFEAGVGQRLKWMKKARLSESHHVASNIGVTSDMGSVPDVKDLISKYLRLIEASPGKNWPVLSDIFSTSGVQEMRNNVV